MNQFHTFKSKTERRERKTGPTKSRNAFGISDAHFLHTSAWKFSEIFSVNSVDQFSANSSNVMLTSPLGTVEITRWEPGSLVPSVFITVKEPK